MRGGDSAEAVQCLSEQAIELATGWGVSIAVAESITGGLVCDALVSTPGASAVLRGGVVAYSTDIKASVLGVDATLLEREGPVHPEVAVQMARGVARVMDADVGIGTTGVAGPSPQGGRAVGTVFVGLALPGGRSRAVALDLSGGRQRIRADAAGEAMRLLVGELTDAGREQFFIR